MQCPACQRDNPAESRFCGRCGAPLPEPGADPGGMIGQVVGGRYRVTRVIGEGGMGVVYEAEQRMGEHSRRVAIKTLLPELSEDHAIVSRFYRESGVVAQLEHPNTIRFYDFGETPGGQLYIAMELVRGRSLTEVIEDGPLSVERVRHILRQVAGALDEAHALGIIHRDLKPDNIILTERGGEADFVKLLDFGIATRVGPDAKDQTKLTQQGMVLGTPPYMSPEQLAGDSVDPRSDIYSLGIIAYEMLTGRLPFEADTPWMWASKHMTEAPRPPSTVTQMPIPREVESAVLHALEKAKAARPATAMDFWRELSGEAPRDRTEPGGLALADTFPGQAGPPQVRTAAAMAAPVAPPPPRRSRAGVVLATLGLLVGGGLALAALMIKPAPPETPLPPVAAGAGSVELAPLGQAQEPPISSEPVLESKLPPRVPSKPPSTPAPTPVAPPPQVSPPPVTTPPVTPPVTPAPPPSATPPPPPSATPPPALPPPPTGPQLPSGPRGDEACRQSDAAARSGNIEGAVALYKVCASTGGSPSLQVNARARIQMRAPDVVKRRAFLDNCAGARAAASAASSIGAGGPAQNALAQTSCAN